MRVAVFLFLRVSGAWVARTRSDLGCLALNNCASNPPEIKVTISYSVQGSSKDSGSFLVAPFKSDEGFLVSLLEPLEIKWEISAFVFKYKAKRILRAPRGYKQHSYPLFSESGCNLTTPGAQNPHSSPICCLCETLPESFCKGTPNSNVVFFDFERVRPEYRLLRLEEVTPSAGIDIRTAGKVEGELPFSLAHSAQFNSGRLDIAVEVDWPVLSKSLVGKIIALPAPNEDGPRPPAITALSTAWVELPEEEVSKECGGLRWTPPQEIPSGFCEQGFDPCAAGQIEDFLELDKTERREGRLPKFAVKDRLFKSGWALEGLTPLDWSIFAEADLLFDFSFSVKIKLDLLNVTVTLPAVWTDPEGVELVESPLLGKQLKVSLTNMQFFQGVVTVEQNCGELSVSPLASKVLLPPNEKNFAVFEIQQGEVINSKTACHFEVRNDLEAVLLRLSWIPKSQSSEL